MVPGPSNKKAPDIFSQMYKIYMHGLPKKNLIGPQNYSQFRHCCTIIAYIIIEIKEYGILNPKQRKNLCQNLTYTSFMKLTNCSQVIMPIINKYANNFHIISLGY